MENSFICGFMAIHNKSVKNISKSEELGSWIAQTAIKQKKKKN